VHHSRQARITEGWHTHKLSRELQFSRRRKGWALAQEALAHLCCVSSPKVALLSIQSMTAPLAVATGTWHTREGYALSQLAKRTVCAAGVALKGHWKGPRHAG